MPISPPPFPGQRGHGADFSQAVLEDLYRYPLKREPVAYALWALTGLFGGHRFYLDRTGTGLLMLFTVGGCGLWWLLDLPFLRRKVTSYNENQAVRKLTGQAPRQLAFMPPIYKPLPSRPAWADKRSRPIRLVADTAVLILVGSGLGRYAAATGTYEPIVAIVALLTVTLLGARWNALARLPVLRGFDRWSHRLRLFYLLNDPGSALSLAFRQVLTVFAVFRKRIRAEARLYLQLGAWFTIIFSAFDLREALGLGGEGGFRPQVLLLDMFQTFFGVYAFAAPVGALITKHLLLRPSGRAAWLLALVALASIALGLFGPGSIIGILLAA